MKRVYRIFKLEGFRGNHADSPEIIIQDLYFKGLIPVRSISFHQDFLTKKEAEKAIRENQLDQVVIVPVYLSV